MKPLIALALAASLAGCTTTRYVQTYCIGKDQALPDEPERVHNKLTGKADEDVKIVAGSAIRLRAYGQGLRGIIEGCREPTR